MDCGSILDNNEVSITTVGLQSRTLHPAEGIGGIVYALPTKIVFKFQIKMKIDIAL